MKAALLEVAELTFLRGDEPILEGVDLTAHAGEVVMIRGGNGSGKTTLLKAMAGLIRAEDDTVFRFEQKQVHPAQPEYHRELMYVGHQLGIKLDLTSLENQRFFDSFLGDGTGDPATTLDRVGLAGYRHTPAIRLSAGQKKRLALSRLLLNRRPVWLLDEPYSNLDQPGIELVDGMLQEHVERDGTAIITSHGTFTPALDGIREVCL
ncbi:MAG: heme ABC exporter ATP-binding protein CcmA [Pseudomonadota bacterium]